MTKQSEIREGIARRKLEIVTRCESRLVGTLPRKVQKILGYEQYTWDTIPEAQKFFWLQEADKEIKDLASQGVVIKTERELPKAWTALPHQIKEEDRGWVNKSYIFLTKAREQYIKLGYVAVEPLTEGEHSPEPSYWHRKNMPGVH